MSEVKQWLMEIGIPGIERLSHEFESKGFSTRKSLEYMEDGDLDFILSSPKKLLLAEKRALTKELQRIRGSATTTKQSSTTSSKQLNFGQSSTSGQQEALAPLANNSQASSMKAPLDSRAEELSASVKLLEVQVQSAEEHVSKLKAEESSLSTVTRGRICSSCHRQGHNRNTCQGFECESHLYCGLKDKHPELKKNISEGQKIVSNLKKSLDTAKHELEQFKMQLTRARGNFFAVMRPRLKQLDPIKYLNRPALDKDLLILQKALGKTIPPEADDWKLPHVIESYKRHSTPLFGIAQTAQITATTTATNAPTTVVTNIRYKPY